MNCSQDTLHEKQTQLKTSKNTQSLNSPAPRPPQPQPRSRSRPQPQPPSHPQHPLHLVEAPSHGSTISHTRSKSTSTPVPLQTPNASLLPMQSSWLSKMPSSSKSVSTKTLRSASKSSTVIRLSPSESGSHVGTTCACMGAEKAIARIRAITIYIAIQLYFDNIQQETKDEHPFILIGAEWE